MVLHRPIETARLTGHVVLGQFHLSGLRVYRPSGLLLIQPNETLAYEGAGQEAKRALAAKLLMDLSVGRR